MPLSKIISESVDLTDNFNFLGQLQQNGAGIGGANTPSFFAIKSSSNAQVIADATGTQVTFDSEIYDTHNAFSSSTFTIPSGHAGKYFFYGTINLDGGTYSRVNNAVVYLLKNGTIVGNWNLDLRSHPIYAFDLPFTDTQICAVGDAFTVNGYVDVTSGTPSFNGNSDNRHETQFGGFKIIE
jgi:hypothetical protein